MKVVERIAEEINSVRAEALAQKNRVDNPHAVTKSQVGLGLADNTADSAKNVLSASKLTTARNINGTSFNGAADITTVKWGTARTMTFNGDLSGSAIIDGSIDKTIGLTLGNSGIIAGTYNNSATANKPITVDLKGRIVAVGEEITVTPAWGNITGKPTTISGYGITDAYTKSQTDNNISTAVSSLVDSSPGTLDTLNELAAALGDDPNFATTVSTQIGTKVDKVTGKQLSAEDYTTAEKTKLSGIANGATANGTVTGSGTTSGANTGDETLATIKSKLGISTLSGSNTGDQTTISGNAGTATKLQTARTIALTGDVTGSVNFDGSGNVSVTTVVVDDSHNHIISNVDGLQSALDLKADKSQILTNVPAGAKFTDTVYNDTDVKALVTVEKNRVDANETDIKNSLNALMPHSGYAAVSKKLDNFVFKTDASFIGKVADNNRFIKFGNKVVDTYGPELVINGDFSNGTTGWIPFGASLVVENSKGLVTGSANQRVNQNLNLVAGNTYIISGDIKSKDNSTCALYVFNADAVSSDPVLITSNATSFSKGSATFVAKADTYISMYMSGSGAGYFDNISVREIQTLDFADKVPDVTVHNQTANGNNIVSAVAKDDFVVVDKKELVINGTFETVADGEIGHDNGDGTVDGWSKNGSTLSIVANTFRVTKILEGFGYTVVPTTIGVEYTVLGTVLNDTAGSSYLQIRSSSGAAIKGSSLGAGEKSFSFTATTTTTRISCEVFGSNGGKTADFDNISVKLVEDTYRAKQLAPIGTSIHDTAYFEPRDYVSNKVLGFHRYDTVTNTYQGTGTEVLYTDVYATQTTKQIMLANGYSEVRPFLYSKGTDLIVPVGTWDTLNKGLYEPILNQFGTAWLLKSGVENYAWYDDYTIYFDKVSSTSMCFSHSGDSPELQGTTITKYSTRPDSKWYDIVYPDQFRDLREYAKLSTSADEKLLSDDKIENGVEDEVGTLSVFSLNGCDLRYYFEGEGTYVVKESKFSSFEVELLLKTQALGGKILIGNKYYYLGYIHIYGEYFYISELNGTKDLINHIPNINIVTNPNAVCLVPLPIQSSGSKLSIDLIGSPTNYPQTLKDKLALGKPVVVINPLLVGENGESYMNNGLLYTKLKNKAIGNLHYVQLSTRDSSSNYIVDNISNCSLMNTDTEFILSYTSSNKPLNQTTHLPVLEVESKVIASNSHSIYKGARIGNQITSKIAVGNGANGFESKVLENCILKIADYYSSEGLLGGSLIGKIIYIDKHSNSNIIGNTYTTLSTYPGLRNLNDEDYTNQDVWKLISGINSIPKHSTIALDNSASPASKHFKVIEEDSDGTIYSGVFGKEIVWDYDVDSSDEFIDITMDSAMNLHLVGTYVNIVSGELNGYYQVKELMSSGTFKAHYDLSNLSLDTDGNIVWVNGNIALARWDGDGFGDNNKFEQLNNGTLIDLNGNTIKTFHGNVPLNIKRR